MRNYMFFGTYNQIMQVINFLYFVSLKTAQCAIYFIQAKKCIFSKVCQTCAACHKFLLILTAWNLFTGSSVATTYQIRSLKCTLNSKGPSMFLLNNFNHQISLSDLLLLFLLFSKKKFVNTFYVNIFQPYFLCSRTIKGTVKLDR